MLRKQVSAVLVALLGASALSGCGVFPKRTIKCEAVSPTERTGTSIVFILDGYRFKVLGGSTAESDGTTSYFVPPDALAKDKGWDKVQFRNGRIAWEIKVPEIVDVDYEFFNEGEWRLVQTYTSLSKSGDPIAPTTNYECKDVEETPEEIVADLKRQDERQKAEVASREAEKLRERQIADGTYQPTEFEVGRPCKELAKENSLTKDVDWGFLGGANSKWFPQLKTIILEGKTKNAFGVNIPFSIECRWEKGGVVRVVEITQ